MRAPLPPSLREGLEERRTWYRLTDRALRALSLAHAQAVHLGSGSLEPAHLALGLTLVPEGVAAIVVRRLGVDQVRLQRELEHSLAALQAAPARDPHGSDTFWRVMRGGFDAADARNTPWVGTEHLLASVLDPSSPCSPALARSGVTSATYSDELERFFTDGRAPDG